MTNTNTTAAAAQPFNQPLRIAHNLRVRYTDTKELHRWTYRWIAQDGTAFTTKKAAVRHNLLAD
jgi:hypothetical protein